MKLYNIYNVGFKTSKRKDDETQIDIQVQNITDEKVIEKLNIALSLEEQIEMFNIILSLKEEMDIQEVTYIDYIRSEIRKEGD